MFRWLERDPAASRFDMICVNLSSQSVGDPAFRLHLGHLGRLCFETTETAVITRLDEARMLVDALHARRVKLALDDFGAGASWTSYLTSLPVDYMKIAGQLIHNRLHDPPNRVALLPGAGGLGRCGNDRGRRRARPPA